MFFKVSTAWSSGVAWSVPVPLYNTETWSSRRLWFFRYLLVVCGLLARCSAKGGRHDHGDVAVQVPAGSAAHALAPVLAPGAADAPAVVAAPPDLAAAPGLGSANALPAIAPRADDSDAVARAGTGVANEGVGSEPAGAGQGGSGRTHTWRGDGALSGHPVGVRWQPRLLRASGST
jgi:hypothetical protein